MGGKFTALVGESPNDTVAIKALLEQKFPEPAFRFGILLPDTRHNDLHGSKLDEPNGKFFKILRLEFEDQKPEVVVLVRDLDALKADKTQLRRRKDGFSKFNRIINKKGLFLLNIYEIEALILADIEIFNQHFGTNLEAFADPMEVPEPKEVLMDASKGKYKESDCPKLFKNLRFEVVQNNCAYFNKFASTLQKRLT